MNSKNINPNKTKNVIFSHSSARVSQGAVRPAIEQGSNSAAIAAELRNSPQVADLHYTGLMHLLAFPNQKLTADECIKLFNTIENKDLQKKAYKKIIDGSYLSPEEKLKFQDSIQDPTITSASLGKINKVVDFDEQEEALYLSAIDEIQQQYPSVSTVLAKAKLIKNQDLQQEVLYNIFQKTYATLSWSLNEILEAYGLINADLQNSAFKNELFKKYFQLCESRKMMHLGEPSMHTMSFIQLIKQVFDSVNEEEMRTILLGIAKYILNDIDGYFEKQLFQEIYNRTPKNLQKEFVYALLNQPLHIWDWRNNDDPFLPYTTVLEFFMPASSVCDEDIDGLIENIFSKAVQDSCEPPLYNNYSHKGESIFQNMCTAVLNLYMPAEQISLEKKNLMIEVIACNQSLTKDLRKKIIEEYIQDPSLVKNLLFLVDQGLQDQRLKKTKLAARDEDPS